MKADSIKSKVRGFSLLEVLVVIGSVLVLLLLVMGSAYIRPRTSRINCVSNLKQIGLAMRMFSNDHNDKFPWAVSTNQGGSMEFAGTGQVFRHFQAASNELNTPKILACPVDQGRVRATAFDMSFSNSKVSYFVGLDSDEIKPTSILSGDRTLTTNKFIMTGFLTLTTNSQVRWAKGTHPDAGNIGLADGSAQEMSAVALQTFTRTNAEPPLRLIIP